MSASLKHAAVLSMVVVFTMAVSSIADAAEKIEQTCVKTNVVTAYTTTVQIGEGHELTQTLEIGDFKCSTFKTTSEWAFVQIDSIDGSGKIHAYFVDYHEDGSQTYGIGEGTNKVTAEPDGSWQATWEGTYKYLGGTGKYQNIKGGGTFKGQASSKEPATEEAKEVVEY
jgi:hypothetical protein